MTDASRLTSTPALTHAHATLVTLAPEHTEALHAAAGDYDETFRYFSHRPAAPTVTAMRTFIDELINDPANQPWCVIDPADDTPVGVSAYLDIREHDRTLEVGHTWYTARARGTKVSPAAKLLLFSHAFDTLGFERVCLKTDERNARSRRAMEKLGAVFEGVLREVVPMPDGFRRSSAYYSVLRREWPGVRERLEARLR